MEITPARATEVVWYMYILGFTKKTAKKCLLELEDYLKKQIKNGLIDSY